MNGGSASARLIHTGSRGQSALVSPSSAGGAAVGSRGMVAFLLPTVGHNVKHWPRDQKSCPRLAISQDRLKALYQFLPHIFRRSVTARLEKMRSLMILPHLSENDRGATAIEYGLTTLQTDAVN